MAFQNQQRHNITGQVPWKAGKGAPFEQPQACQEHETHNATGLSPPATPPLLPVVEVKLPLLRQRSSSAKESNLIKSDTT
jgi:hypothetical protein